MWGSSSLIGDGIEISVGTLADDDARGKPEIGISGIGGYSCTLAFFSERLHGGSGGGVGLLGAKTPAA